MSVAPGLWPREEPRPTTSSGERAVWRALAGGLPPGWHAWHSLRIRDKLNYLGEGDFILAHPSRGLLVLEVKAGRIEQLDGRWFSNGIPLDEAPREQAERFLKKLRRRLSDAGCQAPAWGIALCFPDTAFDRQPTQDDLAGVVIGAAHLPYLKEALPPVVERALPPAGATVGTWIDQLHRLWGETWVPSLSLGARARDLGERRFALDSDQLAILDGLLENERVLVQGGAGSGKTLLAAEAARRHAADGKKVLVLCALCRERHNAHYADRRIMPTALVRSGRSSSGTRHNQSASKKARRESRGWNRCRPTRRGAVRARARSFIARSASR